MWLEKSIEKLKVRSRTKQHERKELKYKKKKKCRVIKVTCYHLIWSKSNAQIIAGVKKTKIMQSLFTQTLKESLRIELTPLVNSQTILLTVGILPALLSFVSYFRFNIRSLKRACALSNHPIPIQLLNWIMFIQFFNY